MIRPKILGISASPRKKGNSDLLLEEALKGARSAGASVSKVFLSGLRFVPCQECEKIDDGGICRIKDGMLAVYKKTEEADLVIVSSPIFFGSVSAQAKMMIDRYQCLWRAKYALKTVKRHKKKKGLFLCVSASARKDFFDNARSVVKNFFAVIGASYAGEVYCPRVQDKGEVLAKKRCLKKAYETARRLAMSLFSAPILIIALLGCDPAAAGQKQDIALNVMLVKAESDPDYLALFVADRAEDAYSRPWIMAKAAAALAGSGKKEGVENMLESAWFSVAGLEGTSYMEDTLLGIADGYVELGKYAKAMEIAGKVKGAFPRVSILCKIALKYAAKGCEEEGLKVLLEAISGLPGAEKESQDISLAEIAKTYSEISRYKEAVETANKMSKLTLKAEVLSTISLGYAKAGHEKNAMQVLSQVEKISGMVNKELDSAAVLMKGAEKYAEIGKKEKADQLLFQATAKISDMKSRFSKAVVLHKIALIYVKTGQPEEALEIAESINDDNYMPRAFAEIAVGFSVKNKKSEASAVIARAVKIAEKSRIEHFKANVLLDIIRSYIKLSDCRAALKLAENMKDDFNKPRAFAEVGLALSRAGDRKKAASAFEKAFETTLTIGSNYYLSWALVDISALLKEASLTPNKKMKEIFKRIIVKSAQTGRQAR